MWVLHSVLFTSLLLTTYGQEFHEHGTEGRFQDCPLVDPPEPKHGCHWNPVLDIISGCLVYYNLNCLPITPKLCPAVERPTARRDCAWISLHDERGCITEFKCQPNDCPLVETPGSAAGCFWFPIRDDRGCLLAYECSPSSQAEVDINSANEEHVREASLKVTESAAKDVSQVVEVIEVKEPQVKEKEKEVVDPLPQLPEIPPILPVQKIDIAAAQGPLISFPDIGPPRSVERGPGPRIPFNIPPPPPPNQLILPPPPGPVPIAPIFSIPPVPLRPALRRPIRLPRFRPRPPIVPIVPIIRCPPPPLKPRNTRKCTWLPKLSPVRSCVVDWICEPVKEAVDLPCPRAPARPSNTKGCNWVGVTDNRGCILKYECEPIKQIRCEREAIRPRESIRCTWHAIVDSEGCTTGYECIPRFVFRPIPVPVLPRHPPSFQPPNPSPIRAAPPPPPPPPLGRPIPLERGPPPPLLVVQEGPRPPPPSPFLPPVLPPALPQGPAPLPPPKKPLPPTTSLKLTDSFDFDIRDPRLEERLKIADFAANGGPPPPEEQLPQPGPPEVASKEGLFGSDLFGDTNWLGPGFGPARGPQPLFPPPFGGPPPLFQGAGPGFPLPQNPFGPGAPAYGLNGPFANGFGIPPPGNQNKNNNGNNGNVGQNGNPFFPFADITGSSNPFNNFFGNRQTNGPGGGIPKVGVPVSGPYPSLSALSPLNPRPGPVRGPQTSSIRKGLPNPSNPWGKPFPGLGPLAGFSDLSSLLFPNNKPKPNPSGGFPQPNYPQPGLPQPRPPFPSLPGSPNPVKGRGRGDGGDSGSCLFGGRDTHELCCWWATIGECDANPYYMRTKCQKSCGTTCCTVERAESCEVNVNTLGCPFTAANPPPLSYPVPQDTLYENKGPTSPRCYDNVQLCPFWKTIGLCQKQKVLMAKTCPHSCGVC